MSVGVKAALITGCAVIIAAILGLVVPFLRKESSMAGPGIVATTSGANSPVIIASGDNSAVIQGADGTVVKNSLSDIASAKDYDAKFENMTKKRAQAAIAVQEYLSKGDWNLVTNNTDGLDEVLGLFEIMGYDEQRGLIGPEVLHEYFYEDIAAYYQASAGYIAGLQKTEGKSTYANIKPLFDAMVKIESIKESTNTESLRWDKTDLINYFQSETNSVNLKEGK